MASLFLNLICEEIPARMQKGASADLEKLVLKALDEAGLAPQSPTSFYGPRHLALHIKEVMASQADREIEKRGPRIDVPDKAIDGFCASVGLSRDELVQEDTGKGVFFFARKQEKGQLTTQLLPQIINDILAQFPWPKSQRWGTSRRAWVRPLHGINLLFDDKLVEGAFDLGGDMSIAYSQVASAHPFYDDTPFSYTTCDEWQEKMKQGKVMVDAAEKSALITAQAEAKATAQNLNPIPDDGLLAEVTGLVEWPNVIMGKIDDSFMSLPEEVLITSMRVHQKYFATRWQSGDDKGQIAPYFMTVANRVSHPEYDELIAKGNERVLRARLSDAAFFWDQDRANPLSSYVDSLHKVTFYEGLGSVGDKVLRITSLAGLIAPYIDGADKDKAAEAARLAKADLVTGMVGEFPELQGLMGGYYARHEGLDEAVADAISDHYRPAGPSDFIPRTPTGLAVSLADKIDTLVGFFGIGAKPTGSKDPFALRRAVLAILRMIDEAELTLPLDKVMGEAASLYGFDAVDEDVPDFILDRLRVMLRDKGISHDVVAAALADARLSDPLLLMVKAQKLDKVLATDEGARLIAGFKRAKNILNAEAKKQASLPDTIDDSLLGEAAEKALFAALQSVSDKPLKEEADIDERLSNLSALEAPINAFFEDIIVNVEDEALRANRLALLVNVTSLMNAFADFTKLEK